MGPNQDGHKIQASSICLMTCRWHSYIQRVDLSAPPCWQRLWLRCWFLAVKATLMLNSRQPMWLKQLRHIALHTLRTNRPTCGSRQFVPPVRGTILHNQLMRSLQWAEQCAVSGIFWVSAVMKRVSPWWRPCAVAESQCSTCVCKCACTDRRPCE